MRLESERLAGVTDLPRPPEREDPTVAGAKQELDAVAAEVQQCHTCAIAAKRTHVVPGVGNPNADLMFIGEAPGADEDRQGEPFVGRAGQLLTKMIEAMGLKREDVFIANILKCRPPNNRDPEPTEVSNCIDYLRRQALAVRPKVICLLGRCAAQAILNTTDSLGRLRGRFHEWNGIPVLPTFHPAYLLRSPGEKKRAWEDLQRIMDRLGLRGK
jgi:DNA polymerase